jgi:hypothetical protein
LSVVSVRRVENVLTVEISTNIFASGYIGRFLALYMHNEQLASEVRLVDKHLPELAFLAPEFSEACSGDKFMQADASKERMESRLQMC